MKLSTSLAQEIVRNIYDVLHQEINFMDEAGIIIASTDPSRLRQRHGGALQVIQTKQPLTIPDDHLYENARKGINVPVFFDDAVIGVIGITGERQDVIRYGQILQKMTQILVRDAYDRDIRHQKRNGDRLWIEALLQTKGNTEDSGQVLIDDLPQTRCCFVYAMLQPHIQEEETLERLHRLMETKPYDALILKKALYPQALILLFPAGETSLLASLTSHIRELGIPACWGIGTAGSTLSSLYPSYLQARQAAQWGRRITKEETTVYEQSELGMLLPLLPQTAVQDFLQTVFSDLDEQQTEAILTTIRLYEQTNGSLKQAAALAHLHKNTFQYRLRQIQERTGYDLRNAHDFAILQTAALLYRWQHPDAADPDVPDAFSKDPAESP